METAAVPNTPDSKSGGRQYRPRRGSTINPAATNSGGAEQQP
jgi:hypothetical protein